MVRSGANKKIASHPFLDVFRWGQKGQTRNMSKWINESTNQSINQTITQSINQSINQINQLYKTCRASNCYQKKVIQRLTFLVSLPHDSSLPGRRLKLQKHPANLIAASWSMNYPNGVAPQLPTLPHLPFLLRNPKGCCRKRMDSYPLVAKMRDSKIIILFGARFLPGFYFEEKIQQKILFTPRQVAGADVSQDQNPKQISRTSSQSQLQISKPSRFIAKNWMILRYENPSKSSLTSVKTGATLNQTSPTQQFWESESHFAKDVHRNRSILGFQLLGTATATTKKSSNNNDKNDNSKWL